LPDLNSSKTKDILNTFFETNIQAEFKFIGIKKSKIDIMLNIKNNSGIYMFFNLVNDNTYIGSSIKLDRRFRVHMSCLV
jgi:excinuclease UvrABC nuclease subunit